MRVIAGAVGGRPLQAPPGRGTRPTSDRLKQTLFNMLGDAVPDAEVLDLYAGSGALGIEALSRGARSAIFVERDPRAARILGANLARCGYDVGGIARVIVADVGGAFQRLLRGAVATDALPAAPPPGSAAGTWHNPAPRAPTGVESPPSAAAPPAAPAPASRIAATQPPPFTLVLADPPYATGEAARLLELFAAAGAPLLNPTGALVAIEHGAGEEMPDAKGNLRLIRRRAQGRGCVSVYALGAPPA